MTGKAEDWASWVPLKVAFAHVLWTVEKDRGITSGSGHSQMTAVPTDDHYAPTQDELLDLLARRPAGEGTLDPPVSDKGGRSLRGEERAFVEAHLKFLNRLQDGSIAAQGIYRYGDPEHQGVFGDARYEMVDRSAWREQPLVQDGSSVGRWTGPVPDYADSRIYLRFDFERGEALWLADIEVRTADLMAGFPSSSMPPKLIQQGGGSDTAYATLRFNSGLWEARFGDMEPVFLKPLKGLAILTILISRPGLVVSNLHLLHAAEQVFKGESPERGLLQTISAVQHIENQPSIPKYESHEIANLKEIRKKVSTKEFRKSYNETVFNGKEKPSESYVSLSQQSVHHLMMRALIKIKNECAPMYDHLEPAPGVKRIVAEDRGRVYKGGHDISWSCEPIGRP